MSASSSIYAEVVGNEDHFLAEESAEGVQQKRFTTYTVVVEDESASWTLHKRYSDFDALRRAVRGRYPSVDRFRFPNKSRFRNFADHTKERRRTGFDDFLALLSKQEIRPVELDEFLHVSTRGADATINYTPVGTPGEKGGGRYRSESTDSAPSDDSLLSQSQGQRLGGGGGATVRERTAGGVAAVGWSSTPKFPPLARTPTREGRGVAARGRAAAAAAAGGGGGGGGDGDPRGGGGGTRKGRGGGGGVQGAVYNLDAFMQTLFSPFLLAVMTLFVCGALAVVLVYTYGGVPCLLTIGAGAIVGTVFQSQERLAKVYRAVFSSGGRERNEQQTTTAARVALQPQSPQREDGGGVSGGGGEGSRQSLTPRKAARAAITVQRSVYDT